MPQTDEKLKVFLEETDDVRLADDGKSMRILLCGKTPTMDKSNKKSISARLKFFRCGHVCSVPTHTEQWRTGSVSTSLHTVLRSSQILTILARCGAK